MSSTRTVSIKLTNNQTGGSLTANVPVGGHWQPIAEAFAGATGSLSQQGGIVASVIEFHEPGLAGNVTLVTGPTSGPSYSLRPNDPPLKVNNGQPLNITSWMIFVTV
ncbi:MAG: hypothetical protein Q9227_009088 [Pyrenula ochraceoflavens]